MQEKTLFRLAIICLFSTAILCAEYSINLNDAELFSNQKIDTIKEAHALKSEIDHKITLNINTTNAIAAIVKTEPNISTEKFMALSSHILNSECSAIEIQLTKGTIITHTSQPNDPFNSIGFDILENTEQSDSVKHAIEHNETHIDGPYPMIGSDHNIIIIRSPILINNNFYGFSMFLVDFDLLVDSLDKNISFAIRNKKYNESYAPAFFGDQALFEDQKSITIDIPLRNNNWQLALEFHPKLSTITFKAIIYLFAILLATSCSITIYLAIKFRNLSIRDPLTGAYNRRHLQNIYKEHAAEFALSFDIDHFKKINDQFGHDVGDQAIIKFCTAIKNSIRPDDHLFRLGGEEFLVIIHKQTDEHAKLIAERVRTKVLDINFREGFRISTSIGLTRIQENESLHSFLTRIDDLLYVAKENGRNRVEDDFTA